MVKLPKKFSVGEKIFAKVRGYPPWPAKIDRISDANTKNAKYHVTFYGTHEVGVCKIEDLFQYADNKEKFIKTTKRKHYQSGIQELEEELKKYPNPSSTDSSKGSESAENVPENVDDPSEKESETTILSSVDGEGDNEAGNLVIDEGDKKRAVKRKAPSVQNTPDVSEVKKKRGRKSMATIMAENAALKQDSAHDSQDEDSEKKVVSRSGRKIKPKRFHDFSDAEIPTDPSKNDQSVRSRTKSKTEEANENQETPIAPIKKRMSVESKISTEEDAAVSDSVVDAGGASPGYSGRLLVARTRAGVPVGIKLDVDRPDRFESEAARARWDLSVARNAMRLKEQLENGDIATELIKDSLDFNVHVPEDDRKAQVKDEADVQNQNRLRILRIESQIMFLDTQIRSSLGLDQANADECLESMNQLLELQVTPFMLKKYSPIVETIKRLRRYVGNLPDWKFSEEETAIFKEKADQIKKKAELIYNKFKSLFTIPEGRTFWETFTEQVDIYKQYTKDMTPDEVYALLTDPTETVKPGVESSTDLASSDKSDTTAEPATDKNTSVVELDAAE